MINQLKNIINNELMFIIRLCEDCEHYYSTLDLVDFMNYVGLYNNLRHAHDFMICIKLLKDLLHFLRIITLSCHYETVYI